MEKIVYILNSQSYFVHGLIHELSNSLPSNFLFITKIIKAFKFSILVFKLCWFNACATKVEVLEFIENLLQFTNTIITM